MDNRSGRHVIAEEARMFCPDGSGVHQIADVKTGTNHVARRGAGRGECVGGSAE